MRRGLTLFILVFLCCTGKDVIPAKIERRQVGREAYVADVYIGTPLVKYRLEVNFNTPDLIIYTDMKEKSTSYSMDSGGSDVVYIGNRHYRMPLISDPYGDLEPEDSHCVRCRGVIGMRQDSIWWRLWPEISFGRASIVLGSVNAAFLQPSKCTACMVHCTANPLTRSLCETRAYIHAGNESFGHYTIQFALHNGIVRLPAKLYDAYMKGKNVYKDDHSKWPDIKIQMKGGNALAAALRGPEGLQRINALNLNAEHCPEEMTLTVRSSLLVHTLQNHGKIMMLTRDEDDNAPIQLGTALFREAIFHRGVTNPVMLVQQSTTNDFLSIENLILLAILIWLLMKWKMTDISISITKEFYRYNRTWNILYEFAAVPITIAAYVLPSTLRVLQDFQTLYIITGVLLGFTLALKVWGVMIVVRTHDRYEHSLKSANHTLILEANLMRTIGHEILILLGMWLLLLERRLEAASTFLVLFVNVYIIYDLSFYLVIISVYYIYLWHYPVHWKMAQRDRSWMWSILVFSLPVIYAYQVFATFNFFARPLFVRNSQIYKEVIIPSLIFLYLFLVSGAVYMVQLYMKKGLISVYTEYEEERTKSGESNLLKL